MNPLGPFAVTVIGALGLLALATRDAIYAIGLVGVLLLLAGAVAWEMRHE